MRITKEQPRHFANKEIDMTVRNYEYPRHDQEQQYNPDDSHEKKDWKLDNY